MTIMKLVRRMVTGLVMPQKRRGFSRIDLIMLLLLGVLVTTHVLISILRPETAHASQAISVPAHASSVKSHVGALAIPRLPLTSSSGHTDTTSNDPCIVNPDCITSPALNKQANVHYPLSEGDTVFFLTNPGTTVGQNAVQLMSGYMLNIVDVFAVVVLILMGLRIMLGGSVFRHANVIEMLPGVLLALVAAHISLSIVTLFLGLNNALSSDFYNYANGLHATESAKTNVGTFSTICAAWDVAISSAYGGPAAIGSNFTDQKTSPPPTGNSGLTALWGLKTISQLVGNAINCNPFGKQNVNQTLQNDPSPADVGGGGINLLYLSITKTLPFIASVLALMLIGQMVIRLFLIDFYIIIAPLGIGCWALPGRAGQQLTRLWMQGFFSTLFVQFLQVVALCVMRLMTGSIATLLFQSFATTSIGNDPTMLWVLVIAQFWFLLRIPSLLGTAPVNMMVNFGQTMSQVAQTVATIAASEVQFGTSIATSAAGSIAGLAAIAR